MQRTPGAAQHLLQPLEGRRLAVVTLDVAQLRSELRERGRIDPAVVLQAVAGPLAQPIERPAGTPDADDRHVEPASAEQRLQRREDLLVGQISRGAEEDEGIGGEICGRAGWHV